MNPSQKKIHALVLGVSVGTCDLFSQDMNETLAAFVHLKEKDDDIFTQMLCEQQNQVIAAFGGLTNMIELCLTNANLQQHIDTNSQQFNSFKKILEMQMEMNDKKDINTATRTGITTNVQNGHSDIELPDCSNENSNDAGRNCNAKNMSHPSKRTLAIDVDHNTSSPNHNINHSHIPKTSMDTKNHNINYSNKTVISTVNVESEQIMVG